jgi:uncharacterized protein YcfJ
MACGTPVVAFRHGSVPEIIDDGVTGFVVNDVEESLQALDQVNDLDRERCRKVFEERFSAARMVKDYLRTYDKVFEARVRTKPRRIKEAKRSNLALRTNGETGHAGSLQSDL